MPMDESWNPPPAVVSLKDYVDAQIKSLQDQISITAAAHARLHQSEAEAVAKALQTHTELHLSELKASEGMRSTTRWALTLAPAVILAVIALVYFVVYTVRGGH